MIAARAKVGGESDIETVHGVNSARADALDIFEQLFVIGVVGKRKGRVRAKTPLRVSVGGPSGNVSGSQTRQLAKPRAFPAAGGAQEYSV